jgi:ribosomal protein S18 acetylase RimI-like enzyme
VEGAVTVGFAHAMSDGIEAYLAVLAVARHRRREGIGSRLIDEIFARTGVSRMDLLSAAADFYRSRPHTRFEGFRLYPRDGREASGLDLDIQESDISDISD